MTDELWSVLPEELTDPVRYGVSIFEPRGALSPYRRKKRSSTHRLFVRLESRSVSEVQRHRGKVLDSVHRFNLDHHVHCNRSSTNAAPCPACYVSNQRSSCCQVATGIQNCASLSDRVLCTVVVCVFDGASSSFQSKNGLLRRKNLQTKCE